MTVNIHAAKTNLSRLVRRAERGESITIARDGKPVAQLGPPLKVNQTGLSPDDPLLNLDSFAVAGRGGRISNEEIDKTLYGA